MKPPAATEDDFALSGADAERYRRIFALQETGDWAAADREIADLTDRRLMGHVQAQRLLHKTGYKARFEELRDWLSQYADHPDAPAVFGLAQRRQPSGAKGLKPPPRPASGVRPGLVENFGYKPPSPLRDGVAGPESAAKADQLRRRIAAVLSDDPARAAQALDEPDSRALLGRLEADGLRAALAQRQFMAGRNRDALRAAQQVARRGDGAVPEALWYGGLAAWRLGRLEVAGRYFAAVAESPHSPPWLSTAGAFWAGRVYRRQGNQAEARQWFATAALYPRTFYGLLANQALGQAPAFRWEPPALTPDHYRALAAIPAGRRAVALMQVGRADRAERELRTIDPGDDERLEEALVALADRGGMAGLALTLGTVYTAADGGLHDAALYPLPAWRPKDGFSLDPALVFGVMRQESRFQPKAKSGAGALGVMQLMPATASALVEEDEASDTRALLDPEHNMTLAQRYLRQLLDTPEIGDNLVLLTAAYNAGPGNLSKWRAKMDHRGDPLLFVESLPSDETRAFVQRVLTNYWLYRHRMGQSLDSLAAVAKGQWPRYQPARPARDLVAETPLRDIP
ncbi:MAG TPA: lytic transglycosylase domain-containing protein [Alphaproteobacteria bacterium]|nr:lytic transglycosylase domain-containing protein [Alphaproteobacteria bacterium]